MFVYLSTTSRSAHLILTACVLSFSKVAYSLPGLVGQSEDDNTPNVAPMRAEALSENSAEGDSEVADTVELDGFVINTYAQMPQSPAEIQSEDMTPMQVERPTEGAGKRGREGDFGESQRPQKRAKTAADATQPKLKEGEQFFKSGERFRKQGNVAGAIADYGAALAIPEKGGRSRARTFHSRGVCKFRQGDHVGALADYDAALAIPEWIGRDRAWTFHERAHCKSRQGNFLGATVDYREALTIPGVRVKSRASTLHNLGFNQMKLGDYYQAIATFTEALGLEKKGQPIRLGSRRARTLRYRGESYSQQGNPQEAMADFEEAFRCDRGSDLDFKRECLLGESYVRIEEYSSALRTYLDALSIVGVEEDVDPAEIQKAHEAVVELCEKVRAEQVGKTTASQEVANKG